MDMYRGAGFAQGLAQGMQTATDGMLKAESIKQNRDTVRQQAELAKQQLTAGSTTQQFNDIKLEQLTMELQQLRREKTKDITFNGLRGYMREGDVTHLNSAVNSDPQLRDLLTSRGITQFQDPRKYSTETLDSLGYNSGNFVIPTIVLGADGKEKIVDLYGTMLETGYANNFTQNEKLLIQSKLDAIALREAQVKDSQSMLTLETMNAYVEQYGQKDGMMKYYEDLTKAKEKPLTEIDKVRLQTEETKLKTAEVEYEKAGIEKQKLGLDVTKSGLDIKGKEIDLQGKQIEQKEAILDKVGKIGSLNNSIAAVDNLLKRSSVLEEDGVLGTAINMGAEFMPGSKTSDFFKSVETIDSQLWMDAIKEMKGLGALSNTEGDRVAKAIANLKSNQSKSQIVENLKIVKNYFATSKKRAELGVKVALDAGDTIGSTKPTPKIEVKGKKISIAGREFTIGQQVTNKNGTFLITENGPKKVK